MKKIKRLTAIILCVTAAILFAGCTEKGTKDSSDVPADTSVSAKTDENSPTDGQPVISAGEVKATEGKNVVVPFTVSRNCKIAAMDIVITYDGECLEYVSASAGSLYSDGIVAANGSDGKVKLSVITLYPPEGEGEMFTVTFKAIGKSGQKSAITTEVTTCCESVVTNRITPTLKPGSVTIE